MSRPPRRDQGAAAVELTLLVPIVTLLVAMAVGGGRVWLARTAVEQAAHSAARAATLARGVDAAQAAAQKIFRQNLRQKGIACQSEKMTIDTSGFAVRVGRSAMVTVRVDCRVNLSDVALPGMPGSMLLSATARSPLDTYRER